jgi:hypothetical protein|tara:strand:- start:1247 stop:1621 length:375 start_codon:yes stop_codon:yes gene_type:complete
VSLVARTLEDDGISTVILGSGRDIVEYCGVARFLFTDFPLGNPCGKPWDQPMQRQIVEAALTLLEGASEPRSFQQTPFEWSDDTSWKDNYMRVDAADVERLKQMGDERKVMQQHARQTGAARSE